MASANPSSATKRGGASGKVAKRPFVVNWAPTDRTALETQASDGPVVLAWNRETGEADVLGRCRLTADPYRFVGSSHARQTMKTTTDLELGTNFPFSGPVNLGAKLEQYGEINVEYHTIGELKLDVDTVHVDDLEGSCAGATHVVVALSVGAFRLFAGKRTSASASADVPMAAGVEAGGGKSSEGLDQGGDPAACEGASKSAAEPVDGCDSILAVELLAIKHDSPFLAGERWEGSYECNGSKATSGFLVDDVRDDGSVLVTFDFDYGDAKGLFVATGTPDPNTGAFALEFVEWKHRPSGYVQVLPSGIIDGDKGEYVGKMQERACGDFMFRRQKPDLEATEAAP